MNRRKDKITMLEEQLLAAHRENAKMLANIVEAARLETQLRAEKTAVQTQLVKECEETERVRRIILDFATVARALGHEHLSHLAQRAAMRGGAS